MQPIQVPKFTGFRSNQPIGLEDMAQLIKWKRANGAWTAIETAGLDPARIYYVRHLIAIGRIGDDL